MIYIPFFHQFMASTMNSEPKQAELVHGSKCPQDLVLRPRRLATNLFKQALPLKAVCVLFCYFAIDISIICN